MTDKQYLITEAQRDNYLQIMRNNMQDPDAYDAIAELQSLLMVDANPLCYLQAITSMLPWNSFELVDPAVNNYLPVYTSPQALTNREIAEKCAEICRSRSRSISADGHNTAAANEASKCALAIESHWQTYPSKALTPQGFDEWQKNPYTLVLEKSIKEDYQPKLTPITADDVTDEMIHNWHANTFGAQAMGGVTDRDMIVAAYNAVIKNRSEAK